MRRIIRYPLLKAWCRTNGALYRTLSRLERCRKCTAAYHGSDGSTETVEPSGSFRTFSNSRIHTRRNSRSRAFILARGTRSVDRRVSPAFKSESTRAANGEMARLLRRKYTHHGDHAADDSAIHDRAEAVSMPDQGNAHIQRDREPRSCFAETHAAPSGNLGIRLDLTRPASGEAA
jgi:hypothetical protein